jgi:hypothetical protein
MTQHGRTLASEAAEKRDLRQPEDLHPLGMNVLHIACQRQPLLLDARATDLAKQARFATDGS